jgi:SAM-dependent methyltransferase
MGLQRFGRYWNAVGRREPFDAILTTDGGARGGQWEIESFFSTGRDDVARFMADLSRIVPSAGRGTALDFGCGVGRISRALADHFESVVGVDIASSMVARAQDLNNASPRCRFVANNAPHLKRFPAASFDVIYSRLVLQHVPPKYVAEYVPELVRVLAPRGALMFQLPGIICADPEEAFCDAPVTGGALKRSLPRWLVRFYRRARYRLVLRDSLARMEMFGVERDAVVALITGAGGRVAEIRDDRSHGTPEPGFEYWVTR